METKPVSEDVPFYLLLPSPDRDDDCIVVYHHRSWREA